MLKLNILLEEINIYQIIEIREEVIIIFETKLVKEILDN